MCSTSFELCNEITTAIRPRIDFILKIWDDIGFSSDMKKIRCVEAVTFIDNIMNNMGVQEEQLLKRIKQSIEKIKNDISKLNEELSEYSELPPLNDAPLCELEIQLIDSRKKLIQLKNIRIEKKKNLQQEEQQLCDLLCVTPFYLVKGLVPTEHELENLEYHIVQLRHKKQQRLREFLEKKTKVTQLFDELERVPTTDFEHRVTSYPLATIPQYPSMNPDPDTCSEIDESLMLSNGNTKALDQLIAELEKQKEDNIVEAAELHQKISSLTHRLQTPREEYEHLLSDHSVRPSTLAELRLSLEKYRNLQRINMESMIASARRELSSLWSKCFTSVQSQNRFYKETDTSSNCEICDEVLVALENEVTRMNDYYNENSILLKLVAKRMHLWEQHCEMQRNETNPNRLFDRKCNLLKESKERSKIFVQLTKVQKELIAEINIWEADNNRQFKVDNQPFLEFCELQEKKEQDKKNAEKDERAKAKNRKNQQESLFGSKPCQAAAKRKFLASSTSILKTPTKSKRLNATRATPINKATPRGTPMGTPLRAMNVNQLETPRTRVKKFNTTITQQKYNPYSNVSSSGYGSMLLAPPNKCSTLISSSSSNSSSSASHHLSNCSRINLSMFNTTAVAAAAGNTMAGGGVKKTLVKRYAPSHIPPPAPTLSSLRETPTTGSTSSSRSIPAKTLNPGRRGPLISRPPSSSSSSTTTASSVANRRAVAASSVANLPIPRVTTNRRSISKRQRKSINNLRRSLRLHKA